MEAGGDGGALWRGDGQLLAEEPLLRDSTRIKFLDKWLVSGLMFYPCNCIFTDVFGVLKQRKVLWWSF